MSAIDETAGSPAGCRPATPARQVTLSASAAAKVPIGSTGYLQSSGWLGTWSFGVEVLASVTYCRPVSGSPGPSAPPLTGQVLPPCTAPYL